MVPGGRPVALSVKALRKTYKDVVAVDGIDLEVYAGECFGLLGPNGAGKTTTIEICEGLTERDGGEVVMLGQSWERNRGALRQRLGIQLQETQLAEKLTVLETVQLFRSFYHRGLGPDQVISVVQLEEKRNARVGQLSGGQKQRLAMACALAGDPELLFLDEPTTGLDPQARRQLWALVEDLKRSGRTIILTTHYMDEAERLCDRIAIMDRGRVIALGTARELIAGIGAEHVVAFSVLSGPPDLNRLESLEGVRNARANGAEYELQVEAVHRAVPALLTELERQNVAVGELRTHSPTLEDVFVHLTGRHLRGE